MKEFNCDEFLEQADPAVLKQLIDQLVRKDPLIKQECLDFLKQKIKPDAPSISQKAAEEIWTLWEDSESDLSELDEYGGGPDETTEYVEECLREMEELLQKNEIPKEDRQGLVEEVLGFIRSGNAGMDDALYDIAFAACRDHEDWEYLAESLEKIGNNWPLQQAMDIYRKIGKDEKYLALRAKKMIYGLDYYDLVTFYSEHGDHDRALAVAQEGMEKAQGRMDELREFMAKHFQKIGNRSEYLKMQFIQATDGLSLGSYEQFKKECSPAEWQAYEPQILKILEKLGVVEQLKIRIFRQEYEQALQILQKIGYPRDAWDADTILQAAKALETKFPRQMLEFYQQGLGFYNGISNRKAYVKQARIASDIRNLLINVMNQPEKWKTMIQKMKCLNQKKKAFLEEFSQIIPDWNSV